MTKQELEKELKRAETNLKMLRDGIPIKDDDDNIIGWMEKPDRAANTFLLEKKGRHLGYGDRETKPETKKRWYEV